MGYMLFLKGEIQKAFLVAGNTPERASSPRVASVGDQETSLGSKAEGPWHLSR